MIILIVINYSDRPIPWLNGSGGSTMPGPYIPEIQRPPRPRPIRTLPGGPAIPVEPPINKPKPPTPNVGNDPGIPKR